MKLNYRLAAVLLIVLSFCAIFLNGCFQEAQRNSQLNQNATTPKGRNIISENMQGPYTGQGINAGKPNGSQGEGSGTVAPNTKTIGTTPGPSRISPMNPQQQMAFDMQRAYNIREDLVIRVREARQFNVVVNGITALVGYAPANVLTDANTLRNTIADRVKRADRSIGKVYVTDSADMLLMMTQLSNDIKNGEAADEVKKRFNRLIEGMKPVDR